MAVWAGAGAFVWTGGAGKVEDKAEGEVGAIGEGAVGGEAAAAVVGVAGVVVWAEVWAAGLAGGVAMLPEGAAVQPVTSQAIAPSPRLLPANPAPILLNPVPMVPSYRYSPSHITADSSG